MIKHIYIVYFLAFLASLSTVAQEKLSVQSLYDPSKVNITLNERTVMTTVATAKDISLFGEDANFSIWENNSQRLLYKFTINGFDVKTLLEPEGVTVYFFYKEEVNGDYTIGSKLNIETGVLETHKLPQEYPDFNDKRWTSFYDSGSNKIFINSNNKLWTLQPENLKAELITTLDLPENSYEDILFVSDTSIYIRVTADESESFGSVYPERFAYRDILGVYKLDILSKNVSEVILDSKPSGVFPLSQKRILLDHPTSYSILNTKDGALRSYPKNSDIRLYKTLMNDTSNYIVTGPEDLRKATEEKQSYKLLSVYELNDSNGLQLLGTELPQGHPWNPAQDYFIDGNAIIIDASTSKISTFYTKTKTLKRWDVFSSRSELSLYEGLTLHEDGYFTYHNGVNYVTLQLDPSYQNTWLEARPDLILKNRHFLKDGTVLTSYQASQKKNIGAILTLQDKKGKVIWESSFLKFTHKEDIVITIFFSPDERRARISISPLYYDERKQSEVYMFDILGKKLTPVTAESTFQQGTSFSYYNESNGYSSSHEIHLYPNDGSPKVVLEDSAILTTLKDNRVLLLDTDNQNNFSLTTFRDGKFQKGFVFNNPKKIDYNERTSPFKYIDSKSLIAGVTDGNLLSFWKLDKKDAIEQLKLSNNYPVHLAYSGERLLVYFSNGYIDVIDLNTLTIIASLALHQDENTLATAYFGNDLNFYIPKDIMGEYHFVKEGKALPLSSYELFLNRPDTYIEALGYASPATISIYKEAYQKRLARKGFSETTNYLELVRPELTVATKNENSVVDENFEFTYQLEKPLQTITVYNNGVPVFEDNQVAKGNHQLHTLLSEGENKILIIGTTAEGVETEPQSIEVQLTSPKAKKVYYIGIGVSKYQDSTWNLRYADVDVRSITKQLEERYGTNLIVETLLNEQVTKENLKQLKDTLSQATVNDMVIISFSGHGTIDSKNDFYFATHDIDFENPGDRGFSYQNIEWLLTDIPARRKLLLLDACHSGELEEGEELEVTKLSNENVSGFTPKGGKVIKGTKKSGLKNSFDLMQSLFYDSDRGNGAVVISAAGGKEFAYESAKWNNGVFTYSFLKALEDLSIEEGENDGIISISELKRYIYSSVTKLTNGQQKPTARAENIEWDWEFISH